MNRPNERCEDKLRAEHKDFFYWKAWKNRERRAREHRASIDRDPEFQEFMETIRSGSEEGTKLLREVAQARRELERKNL